MSVESRQQPLLFYTMKIVMTLLVRDEEDILETHLRYHLSRGVDQILITDNRSMDSTPENLRETRLR